LNGGLGWLALTVLGGAIGLLLGHAVVARRR
jgi:hypothetical protein